MKKLKWIVLGNEIDNLGEYDVILFNDINGYLEDGEMNKIIDDNIDNKKNAVYFILQEIIRELLKVISLIILILLNQILLL